MSHADSCPACRDARGTGSGTARRWSLTEKGYAALGQANVSVATRAELEQIARQNREAVQ